ncbi:hypothetical protein N9131_00090 [bacterium]|jgi:hypothetical protein|nr:hypothetical protein [bacterium]
MVLVVTVDAKVVWQIEVLRTNRDLARHVDCSEGERKENSGFHRGGSRKMVSAPGLSIYTVGFCCFQGWETAGDSLM